MLDTPTLDLRGLLVQGAQGKNVKFLLVRVKRRVGIQLRVNSEVQRSCLFILGEFHYRKRVQRQ